MWENFIKNYKRKRPYEVIISSVGTLRKRNTALDLGSGAGVDLRYLKKRFTKAIGVDSEPAAPADIHSDIKSFPIQQRAYDFIACMNTLPFISKKSALTVVSRMKRGLVENGILVLSIFGEHDSWGKEITTFSLREVIKAISPLRILTIEEEEKDGFSSSGKPKHWHVIRIVAQKTNGSQK